MAGMKQGVSQKVGAGIPGDSSRARINEASGQKVTASPGAPISAPKTQSAGSPTVASGTNLVMPVDHPSAKTTRTVSKGGAL